MSRLKLVTIPDKILRAKNEMVHLPIARETAELVDKMFYACKRFEGVGLAAPQIGLNLRLAVVNLEAFGVKPFPIINPEILFSSKKTTLVEEGCLSIPGKFGVVERPHKIKVRFYTLDGEKIEIEVEDFPARVFQHEIDHLNGILIEDKWDESTVTEDTRPKAKRRLRRA